MTELTATRLWQEIHEQPNVLALLLDRERDAVGALASEIHRRQIDHVFIAARGTSDNAARYAQYLLGARNGLPVGLATPSLFTIYKRPPRFGNALVMGISQSGKSPDIVSVVAEASRQGALTAALTNEPESDLGRAAAHVISLHAGQEESVAATKTYSAELTAVAMLSTALNDAGQVSQDLARLPDWVAQALAMPNPVDRAAERYCYMRHCVVIGRGYNYSTAFEIALKIKELTYTIVQPYSSADFMHGPLAIIDPGFPVLVVAPSGVMIDDMRAFCSTARERGAELIVISDHREMLDGARIPLALPGGVPEWLSPIAAILPGQLFAAHLAHARGYDPDRPRALHKVTETL